MGDNIFFRKTKSKSWYVRTFASWFKFRNDSNRLINNLFYYGMLKFFP